MNASLLLSAVLLAGGLVFARDGAAADTDRYRVLVENNLARVFESGDKPGPMINMDLAVDRITGWLHGGESTAMIAAAILVALSFLIFNALRILLYLPQLRTCWRDRRGCQAINLWTWSSWIAANLSTALYLWVFLNDGLGLLLNLGNALMCLATVAVTLVRRRRSSRFED